MLCDFWEVIMDVDLCTYHFRSLKSGALVTPCNWKGDIFCCNQRTNVPLRSRNSEIVIFEFDPAQLSKDFPWQYSVNLMRGILYDPPKVDMCKKGPEVIPQSKSMDPKWDWICRAAGNSQLQPNSVWSWPFHMQSAQKNAKHLCDPHREDY